jgi:hypothetical protein
VTPLLPIPLFGLFGLFNGCDNPLSV